MNVPMPPLPAGFGKMESVFLSKHAVRARDAAVARATLEEAARNPSAAAVMAYLEANTRYWQEVDALPTDLTKPWRQGTPRDAVLVGLRAAIEAMAKEIK